HRLPVALGRALSAAAALPGSSALDVMEESVAVLRSTESGLHLAEALADHGTALSESGRLPEARKVLREAIELAQEMGHTDLVKRVRVKLAAAGGRLPRSRRHGVDSLTGAERRAATLAAQGRSNREIARLLFVQLRTVEIHLTNTYRKLGITGRDQLLSTLASGTLCADGPRAAAVRGAGRDIA
ncbi:helix-turn-helix transcriptional regulator, partial [Streptomyces sp. SID4917]|uniref:helix-turn-helix transcriptional regulator n=1 Tax=Streptomyces sp. SID4917 TaxID=2690269 RepID=UPI0013707CD8